MNEDASKRQYSAHQYSRHRADVHGLIRDLTRDLIGAHWVLNCLRTHTDIFIPTVAILQQNRLLWYGHVLRKDDWVKKCREYEVEGPRPRGRPKRTWREVVREDYQARKLNKEDGMDRCK